MFTKYVPAEEVACIVVETIQAHGGLLEPVPGYFEALQELCHAHNILIAVDDIQQGLGRTGKWSSVDHYHFIRFNDIWKVISWRFTNVCDCRS